MNNLNSGFYKDLDTNFNQAYEMSQKDFSYDELLEMLKNGNIPEKQIAAINLASIREEDAHILTNNLTGCDGKIREAVAFKILQLLKEDKKYVDIFSEFAQTFANATIDINGNICRMIIDCIEILKENPNFKNTYIENLIKIIDGTFNELDKIVFRDKKYTVNKQLFKLYWCLEGLKLFAADMERNTLFPILERASNVREYTIREKTAQILLCVDESKYLPLTDKLKNDENYYVREVFNHPCNIS